MDIRCYESVMRKVFELANSGKTPQEIAEKITELAQETRSKHDDTDDTTIIVLKVE